MEGSRMWAEKMALVRSRFQGKGLTVAEQWGVVRDYQCVVWLIRLTEFLDSRAFIANLLIGTSGPECLLQWKLAEHDA